MCKPLISFCQACLESFKAVIEMPFLLFNSINFYFAISEFRFFLSVRGRLSETRV